MQNLEELIEAGIINENGNLVRPIEVEAITGKESGVWTEWETRHYTWHDHDGEKFISVENYNGLKLYDYLSDEDLSEIRITSLTATNNVKAVDLFGADEILSIDAAGADEDELDSLQDPETDGTLYELEIVERSGYTRHITIFCPSDWC